MNIKVKNQLFFFLFCTLIGSAVGAVIWLFLKAMAMGTHFLWEWIPNKIFIPFYPVLVCGLIGLLVGLFRKKYGDYPEELEEVLEKIKRDKYYKYDNMLVMLVAALLPLMMGASVGPEAGLTGIIVGLCYWAGDNLKFAGKYAKDYSQVGVAVSLGVLFHSPLFGVFQVTEKGDGDENIVLPKSSKLLVYGISIAGGTAVYLLLSHLFGQGLEGLPSFLWENAPRAVDYGMGIVYILSGCFLAWIFEVSSHGLGNLAAKIPGGIRECVGGVCMGIMGMMIPVLMFSGEEAMGELSDIFGTYTPIMWMGIGVLKILATNLCIQSGLKGGHFFPVIFAGVSFAYGLAGLVFPGGGHEVFAAAIVAAALLGGTLKKPLAITMLLALCFPARLCVWILVTAVISSKISVYLSNKKEG